MLYVSGSAYKHSNGILWRKCYRCCILIVCIWAFKGSSSSVHQHPLLYKSMNGWANQIFDNSVVSAGTETDDQWIWLMWVVRFSNAITGSLSLLPHCSQCAESDVPSLGIPVWLLESLSPWMEVAHARKFLFALLGSPERLEVPLK